MLRTAAPRFPIWFARPNGERETYPLRFPELQKFDDFKVIVSRRNRTIPFSSYQRVGVDIWDYPSFGEAPFTDRNANNHIWYGIPGGQEWRNYVNQAIAQGRISSVEELSGGSLSQAAQDVINHMADNLEDIRPDVLFDQREESGFSDTTTAYKRIMERVAQRLTQRVQTEGLKFRPILGGGYIFFANSDKVFWRFDIGGDVDKSRPLEHEQFFNGDNWRNYNVYYAQERWRFMDMNAGSYWQGPNYAGGVFEMLNGIFQRVHAATKIKSLATGYDPRDVLFVWDKCDNQAGAFSYNMEYETTAPAGRVRLRKRVNPPIEWLRLSGWIAPVVKSAYAVWNDPVTLISDRNWITTDIDNDLTRLFFPAGGGAFQPYPKQINTRQAPAGSLCNEGMIDFCMLGMRQGYEVRRALGGAAISAKFIDYKIDGGAWVSARGNLSDNLYGAAERRGVMMEFIGKTGMRVYAYYTPYGDLLKHTFTVRPTGGGEDSFTGLGNGLVTTEPF